jgi:hypothetical protein
LIPEPGIIDFSQRKLNVTWISLPNSASNHQGGMFMRLRVARTRLHEIVKRACGDPRYMRQLRENPVDALVKEGLPYDLIEDFLRESGWDAEVTGYSIPDCANSCALTQPNAYPAAFWEL